MQTAFSGVQLRAGLLGVPRLCGEGPPCGPPAHRVVDGSPVPSTQITCAQHISRTASWNSRSVDLADEHRCCLGTRARPSRTVVMVLLVWLMRVAGSSRTRQVARSVGTSMSPSVAALDSCMAADPGAALQRQDPMSRLHCHERMPAWIAMPAAMLLQPRHQLHAAKRR